MRNSRQPKKSLPSALKDTNCSVGVAFSHDLMMRYIQKIAANLRQAPRDYARDRQVGESRSHKFFIKIEI